MAQKNTYSNKDEKFTTVSGEIIKMIFEIFEDFPISEEQPWKVYCDIR